MEFFGLKDLRVDNDSLAIKVIVCRLWESLNSKKNGEVISLDMVIIDDKQSLMTATIRKNLIDRFNNLLKKGVVYIIQNFKVVPNSSDFRVNDSAFKILLTLITKLKKVDDHPSIPMHGFRFVGQKIIDDRVNDNTLLTDIAGRLTVVGAVETVTGGFRRRDLEFVSDSDILSLNWELLTRLKPNMDAFYMGCKACCRKVTPVDGIYTCRPPCNLESKNALTLYKIHLRVRDETGTISCVVLQKVAERLVDSSALKLLNKSDPNSNEFPSEITALCGQKFVFRLSLSEYNINHGSDAFIVNKVFELDYTLEKKYKDTVEAKSLPLALDPLSVGTGEKVSFVIEVLDFQLRRS
ncbi:hypothetical protein OSB04_006835 [Centaurea solstitialis]|uniref:DUF223 domain-containing protein n=1 Tax=Centaurea solstitialis TaxID=347529 RepID=A0AA38TIP2_9ASTR|nr:hypothetical protein OSB04_006835 [Centaurea solstitialis]